MEQTAHSNDNQPATKSDIRILDARINNVETRLDTPHRDMREIRRGLIQAIMGGTAILGGLAVALIAALLM